MSWQQAIRGLTRKALELQRVRMSNVLKTDWHFPGGHEMTVAEVNGRLLFLTQSVCFSKSPKKNWSSVYKWKVCRRRKSSGAQCLQRLWNCSMMRAGKLNFRAEIQLFLIHTAIQRVVLIILTWGENRKFCFLNVLMKGLISWEGCNI